MESKINYTIVGIFLVALTVALFSFAYWLTKNYGQQSYDTYYVHLSESAAGLTVDGSVKYRGVDVGTVVSIELNPQNPEEVRLLLKIIQETPIKTDTTATISFFGITGLAFIELEGLDKDAPRLKKVHGEIPIIPSRPSIFKRADQALSQLAEKTDYALDRVNRLLGDENLKNFEDLLFETKELAKGLQGQLNGIQRLVDNGVLMESEIIQASQKVGTASTSIKRMAENVEKNAAGISQEMTHGMRTSFNSLNQLLGDLDRLTGSLQTTIQNIEASPSDILFKRTQPRAGPGEKGYHEE